MKVGDLISLKNDENKIIYMILKINNGNVTIKGLNHRIKMNVSTNDIVPATTNEIETEEKIKLNYRNKLFKKTREKNVVKPLFGRILHIDGDEEYLNNCLELYKEMGIHADGIYLDEDKVKDKIEQIIAELTPDIVVITGHDIYNGKGLKEISNYENTKFFMETIRKIRKHYMLDDLCVIAGACGSNYEALIASGANFASSPKRINIHTYDPAVIAIKVASTSINKTIDFEACLRLIENGRNAFGGIETKGKMRIFL